MDDNEQKAKQNSMQQNEPSPGQQQAGTSGTETGEANQNIPLSPKAQTLSQQIDAQIQDFEQQLNSKSNAELKQISHQLEIVEREMLLEKIDNELQTIKETAVRPGDIASTAAAGSTAAAAVQTQQTPTERPEATL